MFSKQLLADIKERISIVAYIGERIPLKRAGRNFKGCCPFHNEKTPSFNVSDDKGIFHCFGCGEGGDVIQFVMKFDGLPFAEAVRHLAGRAGVSIPATTDPQEARKEEESARRKRYMLRTNEIARDWFMARLLDERVGASARRYLQDRGISEEIWKQHFLGYADNSWDALLAHLKERKVPQDIAAELGLIKRRDAGGCYDFFRNRIIFPIVSVRGEVLGFSGRALGAEEGAKYINSPDSLIYHKSNSVYGLNCAHGPIRSADHAILVEGNVDLISLHQAGIENVVAPLGTALTVGHVRLLKRATRNMTLVFDGDEAGERAAFRALEIFIEEGVAPRVAPLPSGEDPDSLVRKEGAEKFRKRLKAAPPLFEFFVDRTAAAAGGDAAGKVAAVGRIVPLLKAVADPAERGIYVRYAARRLDVDEGSIAAAVNGRQGVLSRVAQASSAETRGMAMLSAERTLVELMLSRPEVAGDIFSEVGFETFEDSWCRTVAEILHGSWSSDGKLSVSSAIDSVADPELALQLRQIALEGERWGEEDLSDLVRDCIDGIRRKPSLARLKALNEEIRQAEDEGDDERLLKLLEEKRTLAAQVRMPQAANG